MYFFVIIVAYVQLNNLQLLDYKPVNNHTFPNERLLNGLKESLKCPIFFS